MRQTPEGRLDTRQTMSLFGRVAVHGGECAVRGKASGRGSSRDEAGPRETPAGARTNDRGDGVPPAKRRTAAALPNSPRSTFATHYTDAINSILPRGLDLSIGQVSGSNFHSEPICSNTLLTLPW